MNHFRPAFADEGIDRLVDDLNHIRFHPATRLGVNA